MVDRLVRAAGDGDVAVVRRLLDAGAEVDAPVRAGRTALDLAVHCGARRDRWCAPCDGCGSATAGRRVRRVDSALPGGDARAHSSGGRPS
ncbi:ankyrin repeat domain-containing protein [Streptomyces sp. AmelKG-A3]|nr:MULTISPECIES: ankyrin repeat domain-containing protein [unclassified Streptomyces]